MAPAETAAARRSPDSPYDVTHRRTTMNDEELDAEKVREVTEFVDVAAPPPADRPTALFVFGTNQFQPPVEIVAERYRAGLAPVVIVSGGVNRHTGVVEGPEFVRLLTGRGVPDSAIRCEDAAADTWQNVEFSRPFLHEALDAGLRITSVSKWYHRRTLNCLTTLVPDIGPFFAVTWEPVYGGRPVTREDWHETPDGRRKVLREWEEVKRRVADGSYRGADRVDGAWRA